MKNKTTFIYILLGSLFAVLLFASLWSAKTRYAAGYAAGYDAAKQQSISMLPSPPAGTATFVSGTIREKSTNGLVLDAQPLGLNGFDAQLFATQRNVQITAATKIEIWTQKTDAQLQADLRAYQQSQEANPNSQAVAPDIWSRKTVSLSDLEIGAKITVISDKDVRDDDVITASSIRQLISLDGSDPGIGPGV